MSRHTSCRGFTLVELLVALTLGGLLVASAVSATRALSSARESTQRRMEQGQTARIAMEAIVGELRNLRRDPIKDTPVLVGTHGSGSGNDSINLLVIGDRRSRSDGAESDQYEVGFQLSQSGGVPSLMCRRDHDLDEFPEDGGIVFCVAEGIVSLAFEYRKGESWQKEWSKLETSPPAAVRVTLAAMPTDVGPRSKVIEPTVLSTVVALNVSQPSSPRPDAHSPQPAGGRPQ